MPVFQINFSRPAGQIVAQYYDFVRLGREGYRRVHTAATTPGSTSPRRSPKLGPFELICDSDPQTGIPAVAWKLAEGADPGYTLFDLADRLRIRGWQVPAYPLTGTASDIAVQRILVRQGVSRDLAAILLDDLRDAIAHFTKHPVTVSDDARRSRAASATCEHDRGPLVGARPRRVVGGRAVHGRLRLLRPRAPSRRTSSWSGSRPTASRSSSARCSSPSRAPLCSCGCRRDRARAVGRRACSSSAPCCSTSAPSPRCTRH